LRTALLAAAHGQLGQRQCYALTGALLLRPCFAQLRMQGIDLQIGQHLARLDRVTFIDQHLSDTPPRRGDIDLGSFQTAIAGDQSGGRICMVPPDPARPMPPGRRAADPQRWDVASFDS
jgi:hypothetical protein